MVSVTKSGAFGCSFRELATDTGAWLNHASVSVQGHFPVVELNDAFGIGNSQVIENVQDVRTQNRERGIKHKKTMLLYYVLNLSFSVLHNRLYHAARETVKDDE